MTLLLFDFISRNWRILVRKAVGVLFLYSGVSKAWAPSEVTDAIAVVMPSGPWISFIVISVIILEIWLGVTLLANYCVHYSILIACISLAVFTVFLGYILQLPKVPGCGCGGIAKLFQSAKMNASFGIFRNLLLITLLQISRNPPFGLRD